MPRCLCSKFPQYVGTAGRGSTTQLVACAPLLVFFASNPTCMHEWKWPPYSTLDTIRPNRNLFSEAAWTWIWSPHVKVRPTSEARCCVSKRMNWFVRVNVIDDVYNCVILWWFCLFHVTLCTDICVILFPMRMLVLENIPTIKHLNMDLCVCVLCSILNAEHTGLRSTVPHKQIVETSIQHNYGGHWCIWCSVPYPSLFGAGCGCCQHNGAGDVHTVLRRS